MSAKPLLSICIPTLNRGRFIGETLESIVCQITGDVEVVIVDGGSTDDTQSVVQAYADRFPQIRYIRHGKGGSPSNEGFDRDCNNAVELARGHYCWLMTDDDLLIHDAIAELQPRLDGDVDLLIASVKVCNIDFSNVLSERLPAVDADRRFDRSRWASFVGEVGMHLTFVGRVIIRRELWLAREASRYFGSGFVHAGVILSAPMDNMVLLAKPLVVLRYGNALWQARSFDIWMFQWPALVWSMNDLPDSAKNAVTERHPYRSAKRLLWLRALGAYSFDKYRTRLATVPGVAFRLTARLIAVIPMGVANAICWPLLLRHRRGAVGIQLYDLLKCGHAPPFSRQMARSRGVF